MKRLWCAAAVSALALAYGCEKGSSQITAPTATPMVVGSGVIATEPRPVAGFDAVTVNGPLVALLEVGVPDSLTVTADDNVLPLVVSKVLGGRLYLGFAPETSLTRAREVVCHVGVSRIVDVEATAAARLELAGVEAERLVVRLTGAAGASAAGHLDELVVTVSGASRFSGPGLESRSVTATVSGTSYARVRARELLRADVSGVSTLEYAGDPVVVPVVTGLSVLRRVGP